MDKTSCTYSIVLFNMFQCMCFHVFTKFGVGKGVRGGPGPHISRHGGTKTGVDIQVTIVK